MVLVMVVDIVFVIDKSQKSKPSSQPRVMLTFMATHIGSPPTTFRRLGGLYRLFQASILVYIASSIIFQQRYLKTENVIGGAVRVTLKAPLDGIANSSYCQSSAQPCLFWNENDILYEPGVDGALITTRAQIKQYGPFANSTHLAANRCDVNIPTVVGCDPHRAPSTLLLPTSLVADIERFTIMLEHSIRGQATGIQIRSGSMEYGVLRDSVTGQVLKTFNDASRYVPDTLTTTALSNNSITSDGASENPTVKTASSGASAGENGGVVHLAGDVITVGEFLKAAGVNLDSASGSPTASANETVRSSGVVVIVVIQYAAKGWNPNKISYEYLPKAIPDQEYKVIETIRDFKGGNRVEINRHGIVFSQSGQLGQFSLMTLLTNLVAAVALFKVANIVVELLMLRLHPQKKIYDRAKFESTKDGKGKRRADHSETNEKRVTDLAIQDRRHSDKEESTDFKTNGSGNGGGTRSTDSVVRQCDHQSQHISRHATTNGIMKPSHSASSSENEHSNDDSSESEYAHSREGEQDEESIDSKRQLQPLQNQRILRASQESQDHATAMEHGCASAIFSNAKDLHRRSKTPIHEIQFGQSSSSSLGKSAEYIGSMDWSRNGSSSGLLVNTDSRPGFITKSSAYPYRMRPHSKADDDVEIETRFGPIRPNEFKGFNPGGLVLGGDVVSLASSPQQTNMVRGSRQGDGTAHNLAIADTTPETRRLNMFSAPTNKSQGPASHLQSPPSMQAVSPSPVFFGPHSAHALASRTATSTNKSSSRQHRSRQDRAEHKEGKAKASEHKTGNCGRLGSRHSSSSLSSLSSSSSLTSCEDSACGAHDGQIANSGLKDKLISTPPTSFGLSENPPGYSSGGEICSRKVPAPETTKVLHSSISNPNLSTAATARVSTCTRHGYKKHKTDKHRPALTADASCTQQPPPLFNLGGPSNQSQLSLSLTSESLFLESTTKLTRPGSAVFPSHGSTSLSCSKKPVFGPNASSSSAASPLPLRRSSMTTDATTTVLNMSPFQLPMPAFGSQESDLFYRKGDSSPSATIRPNQSRNTFAPSSSSSKGKDPQRSVRDRTLRTSTSSPSLLNGTSSVVSSGGSGSGNALLFKHRGSLSSLSSSSSASSSDVSELFRPRPTSEVSLERSGTQSMQSHAKELRVAIPTSLSSTSAQVVPGFANLPLSSGSPTLESLATSQVSLHSDTSSVVFQPMSSSSDFPPDSGFQVSTPTTPSFRMATPSERSMTSTTRPYSTYQEYSVSGITTGFSTPTNSSTRPLPSIPPTLSSSSTPRSISIPAHGGHTTARAFGSSSTPNLLLYNSATQAMNTTSTDSGGGPYLGGGLNYSSPSLGLTTCSGIESFDPSGATTLEGSGGSSSVSHSYFTHPTSTFFTSPNTSSCTTTLAGTGIRVLGRTITMVTADNKKLLLRRSEPLILNEGVGEEKAARM
ncbi:cytochrome c oxidase subunit 1 [Podila humilis]|nr:cytochrome c oxidase subunit 1 [Podila humilis]